MYGYIKCVYIVLGVASSTKNPFVINIVGWAMRYMGYQPDPNLKR